MSLEWKLESDNLAVVHVSGLLGRQEYEQIQAEIESIIQKNGQIKILVLLNNFQGWESAEGWEDTTTTDRIDPFLKKMAIVGDLKWKDLVEVFTLKGLRPVLIEYFESDHETLARNWLASD